MSKHETPMTEGFWLSQAHGLFIAEFPLVQSAADKLMVVASGGITLRLPADG